MGKKGSWSSAIKRVFTHCSKDKLNESERKGKKGKKKNGLGKLRHGERTSFLSRFGEPSSIEKILVDAERENKINFRPPTPPDEPITPIFVPTRVESPTVSSPIVASPRRDTQHFDNFRPEPTISNHNASPTKIPSTVSSPIIASPIRGTQHFDNSRPEPTLTYHNAPPTEIQPEPTITNHNASATKIQAAYRGYTERKSFRALKGLVRLQGLVRGNNVQGQIMNAMKQMQLLVRLQIQIQSQRIQMLENQSLQQQSNYKTDKDVESTFGKWTSSQAEDEWEDSVLTKEQVDAKMQRKVEAVIKRERAMAYAYSHKSIHPIPKSAQTSLLDSRTGGFPWWWNWLERQPPPINPTESQVARNGHITPPLRLTPEKKQSTRPQSSHYKQRPFELDPFDAVTPKSTRSTFTPRWKQTRATMRGSMKDDDSLISCPPFSVPNYMTPTASAKAKSRANSNPQDRFQGNTTPNSESKRRLSLPSSNESIGSFKWSKGALFLNDNDGNSPRMVEKRQSFLQSHDNTSVDSRLSLPVGVARKPFNRFV